MKNPKATAVDFTETEIYSPEIRPGYVGWPSIFQFDKGKLGAAFQEIRRVPNPDYNPPSVEYVESIGIPYGYEKVDGSMSPDYLSEYVHMKSDDDGRIWKKTGVSPVTRRHYWYVGLADESMVRLYGTTGYENPYGSESCAIVERSEDGGNTWKKIASFLEGYYVNMFKFRKISDGRLVAAGPIRPSFGPGGKIQTRHIICPGQIEKLAAAFFVSEDSGHTWMGPHYVLPGILANEFDFTELPDGDLLFINSTIQCGEPVRQIVRKTKTGYVNDPLMAIKRGAPDTKEGWTRQQGIVPETFTLTSDGLLVGGLRSGADTTFPSNLGSYSCSKDLGENWYEVEATRPCRYQPMCDLLPDGRVITIWHHGGDNLFGQFDMVIGLHAFAVDAQAIPEPTRLELNRCLSKKKDQYLNSYDVRLTSHGRPLAEQQVDLLVSPVWSADGEHHNTRDITESKDIRAAVTDKNGIAHFELSDKDQIPDINAAYRIQPKYNPPPDQQYSACDGPVYTAYPITPVENHPDHLPIYIHCGIIWITQHTAQLFPELPDIINRLDKGSPDLDNNGWIALVGDEKRAEQLVDFLVEHNILSLVENNIYRWYRSIQCGDNVIKEIRIT